MSDKPCRQVWAKYAAGDGAVDNSVLPSSARRVRVEAHAGEVGKIPSGGRESAQRVEWHHWSGD